MKLAKLILAGVLGVSLFSSNVLAAPAWNIDKDGLKLENTEKQKYISGWIERYSALKFSVPDGWKYDKFEVDGVKMERLTNSKAQKSSRVVLQLHGGGYIVGLNDQHRIFAVKQAVATSAKNIYMLDYRIAPQNVYPAALEDAVKAYKHLLENYKPENIIIMGDSAGGNLALALSVYLKENNLPQPALLILHSPWTTLETDLPSRDYNANRDLVLGNANPKIYSGVNNPVYGGDIPKNDPRLSPLHADLNDLPPILIQVGSYEIFIDENLLFMGAAAAYDLDITLTIYKEMPHDFALCVPEIQETVDSMREVKEFVNLRMKK